MKYTIIAFTIRDKALTAYRLFIDRGLQCKLINTPRAAGLGCGLSVQIEDDKKNLAADLLSKQGLYIDGFFSVTVINNKTIVARL